MENGEPEKFQLGMELRLIEIGNGDKATTSMHGPRKRMDDTRATSKGPRTGAIGWYRRRNVTMVGRVKRKMMNRARGEDDKGSAKRDTVSNRYQKGDDRQTAHSQTRVLYRPKDGWIDERMTSRSMAVSLSVYLVCARREVPTHKPGIRQFATQKMTTEIQ